MEEQQHFLKQKPTQMHRGSHKQPSPFSKLYNPKAPQASAKPQTHHHVADEQRIGEHLLDQRQQRQGYNEHENQNENDRDEEILRDNDDFIDVQSDGDYDQQQDDDVYMPLGAFVNEHQSQVQHIHNHEPVLDEESSSMLKVVTLTTTDCGVDHQSHGGVIPQSTQPQLTISPTTTPVVNANMNNNFGGASSKMTAAMMGAASGSRTSTHAKQLNEATTSPTAQIRTATASGSRTAKAAQGIGGSDQQQYQNKMLMPGSTIKNSGNVSSAIQQQNQQQYQVPYYDKVETLQPKILQGPLSNKGGPKKQTSIQLQQRANVVPRLGNKLPSSSKGAAVFSLNSTKECTFCAGSLQNTVLQHNNAQHSSCFLNSNSSIGKQCNKPFVPPKDLIMSNLGRKYGECHVEFENLKVVNDLIYNEQTHVVSIFKDYLILDDINEFLKRFYKSDSESHVRLPKLCEFYQKYSQVFPNFVSLPESKYMFRNIQRKQRLIDEQFHLMQQKQGGEAGAGAGAADSRNKEKASLMRSANKLFSTGFIESVMNQKNCTSYLDDADEIWAAMKKSQLESQGKKYVESASRLDKSLKEQMGDVMPFQQENLDQLVQKFLHKDTESTIHLNTSLGQIGDEILGKTFTSQERSAKKNMDAEIGVINRNTTSNNTNQNNIQLSAGQSANRMSIIPVSATTPGQMTSFAAQSQTSVATSASKSRTVTGKTGNTTSQKAQQIRLSTAGGNQNNRSKAGSQTSSVKKSFGQNKQTPAQDKQQKSGTAVSSLKQKIGQQVTATSHQQLQTQAQFASNKAASSQSSNQVSNQIRTSVQSRETNQRQRQKTKSTTPSNEDQKVLREKYLECDLGGEGSSHVNKGKLMIEDPTRNKNQRLSANVDSASQSPVEGILNPLSSQPLLSKSSMNQKTTQPGSSLGFFKQRSSEVCIGSATPTQHLYHSKQISFKGNAAAQSNVPTVNACGPGAGNKILPQLNLIQQQAEQDYYSSSSGFRTSLAQSKGGQFLRSQTAMNSVQTSSRPTIGGSSNQNQPNTKTKHVSRERSPPLMQETKQVLKKGKKSPHQKKDRRGVPNSRGNEHLKQIFKTGKNSVNSMKNMNKQRSPQSNNTNVPATTKNSNNNVKSSDSRTSLALSGPVVLAPVSDSQMPSSTQNQHQPLHTQGSANNQREAIVKRQKFYSQTEINEADEDYPEDEVADEIPDDHHHHGLSAHHQYNNILLQGDRHAPREIGADGDDTENEDEMDQQDDDDNMMVLKSDDEEGHINEDHSSSAKEHHDRLPLQATTSLSVRDKLRPAGDMMPIHGGAFHQTDAVMASGINSKAQDEEDTYKMQQQIVATHQSQQMSKNKPRAQTTMNYHHHPAPGCSSSASIISTTSLHHHHFTNTNNGNKRMLSGTNQYDPALLQSSHQSNIVQQNSYKMAGGQVKAVTSISNYGSERQDGIKTSTSHLKPISFNSTQQPVMTQVRRSIQTEIDLPGGNVIVASGMGVGESGIPLPTSTSSVAATAPIHRSQNQSNRQNSTKSQSGTRHHQLNQHQTNIASKTQQKCQLPLSGGGSQTANRPHTNIVSQQQKQSMSIRSKFSRENSVSQCSRHDTQPSGAPKTIHHIVQHQQDQKFFEASMKLGGKALQQSQGTTAQASKDSSQPRLNQSSSHHHQNTNANATTRLQNTLTSSLRMSIEPITTTSMSTKGALQPSYNAQQLVGGNKMTSSQATTSSLLAVSRNNQGAQKQQKTSSENSLAYLKKQHQQQQVIQQAHQYKVDLTTRLASNLISEQHNNTKKKQGQDNFIKHQQQSQSTKQSHQGTVKHNQQNTGLTVGGKLVQHHQPQSTKASSFVGKSGHGGNTALAVASCATAADVTHYSNLSKVGGLHHQKGSTRSGGGNLIPATGSQPWKRKSSNFQSPHAGVTASVAGVSGGMKKTSAENLEKFQAMGSGKASYLTNVVGGVASSSVTQNAANSLGNTSRNFTSPYASTINNNAQRLIPKDSSGGSLPKSKVLSKSPPMSEKEQMMLQQQQRNLLKTSNRNMTLQQQLQQINKQLALSQVKTGSFRRQTTGVSPQSSNSLSKKKTSAAVLTPATSNPGSLMNTGEKSKQRTSSDRLNNEVSSSTKSLQRSYQQNTLKSSMAAAQALISLPSSSKHHQKQNFGGNNNRAHMNGLKASKILNQQHQASAGGIESKSTKAQSIKVGNFFGQTRGIANSKRSSNALSPQANTTANHQIGNGITAAVTTTKTLTKQTKAALNNMIVGSDRSNKSSRGAGPAGNSSNTVQINIFQSSTGELRKAITSMEEVKGNKGITPIVNSRLVSKKQSISGKQLKKIGNQLLGAGSGKALSLSPPHANNGVTASNIERKMKNNN